MFCHVRGKSQSRLDTARGPIGLDNARSALAAIC